MSTCYIKNVNYFCFTDVTCCNFGNSFRTFLWVCAKISKSSVSPEMIDEVSSEVSGGSLLITYYSAPSDEEHISWCKEMEFFKRKSLYLAYAKVLGFISPLMLNFWTFLFLSGSFIRCEAHFAVKFFLLLEGLWFKFLKQNGSSLTGIYLKADPTRPLWAKGCWGGVLLLA